MGIANTAVKNFFINNNIKFKEYIDGDYISDNFFDDVDYIVKSSGIKFDTKFLNIAYEKEITVISDLELFYLFNTKKELIVITGTNGKTTTSTLISNLLNNANVIKSGVYGNIGIPLFSKIDNELTIIEASSFMLHNSYKIKPHIYIITSLVSHHLDYHRNEEEYFYDKLKIISNLSNNDYLIYNLDYTTISKRLNNIKCNTLKYSFNNKNADIYFEDEFIIFQNKKIINIKNLKRTEKHNLENMLATVLVGIIYNIDLDIISNTLLNFNGLEHRFEIFLENNDYIVINDSKSTSPASLETAIDSIKEDKYNKFKKILILGGKIVDKNYCNVNAKLKMFDLIFIFGKDKLKYCKYIQHDKIFLFDTLNEVIYFVKNKVETPLLILFSPSSPSYDLYENFEKRGEHLKNLIFYHNFCK